MGRKSNGKSRSLLIVLSIFFFLSCSLQKRLYTKGFYVDKHNLIKQSEKQKHIDTITTLLNTIKLVTEKKQYPALLAQAFNPKKTTQNNYEKNNAIISNIKPSCLLNSCDTIILKNGTKLVVSIIKTDAAKIIYRNCDSTMSSVSDINMNEVKTITYANGKKVYKNNALAVAGFTLSLIDCPITLLFSLAAVYNAAHNGKGFSIVLFPIFLVFLASIFCIAAIKQIKRKQDTKGVYLAIIGLIMSIILVLVLCGVFIFISTLI